MNKSAIAIITLAVLLTEVHYAAMAANSNAPTVHRDDWPTKAWKTGSPQEHGIDTNALSKAISQLPRTCPEVHSLLLVRHGRLIAEHYFHGKREHDYWNIKSASKSILSALVGIALQEGHLRSLDQPVIDFFPEYREKLNDARKQQITLRHLLTMTAGLEWVENGPISRKWMASRDRVGFTWASKLVATPGTEWNYSTAVTHMLSAVLTRATGTNTFAYARRTLLDPIGAEVNHWDQDPQGYYWGGSEVYMTPRNMAKFGFLYFEQRKLEQQTNRAGGLGPLFNRTNQQCALRLSLVARHLRRPANLLCSRPRRATHRHRPGS
jgi:CubicO group peptidase (beta-lactamase class C family)